MDGGSSPAGARATARAAPTYAVRARVLQVALDHIGGAWPELARELDVALVGARVRATPPIGWLPLDDVLTLQRMIEERLGSREAARLQRSLFIPIGDSPVFHALLSLSKRTMAQHPERALPLIARGWALFYRGCGAMRFEEGGPWTASLVVDEPAPAMLVQGCWQRATASYLEGIFDLADVDGTVRVRVVEGPAIAFRFAWSIAERVRPRRE